MSVYILTCEGEQIYKLTDIDSNVTQEELYKMYDKLLTSATSEVIFDAWPFEGQLASEQEVSSFGVSNELTLSEYVYELRDAFEEMGAYEE